MKCIIHETNIECCDNLAIDIRTRGDCESYVNISNNLLWLLPIVADIKCIRCISENEHAQTKCRVKIAK
jgi:hypothetical protein